MLVGFTVTGHKELDAKFGRAPINLQRGIARKAAREAARPIQKTAQQLVPVDERQLWKTIKIRAIKRTRKNARLGIVGVNVITDKKILEQIHRDRTDRVFNPHWAEFGVPGHLSWGVPDPLPEQPYMRPAADQNKSKVANIFKAQISALVAKLVK